MQATLELYLKVETQRPPSAILIFRGIPWSIVHVKTILERCNKIEVAFSEEKDELDLHYFTYS